MFSENQDADVTIVFAVDPTGIRNELACSTMGVERLFAATDPRENRTVESADVRPFDNSGKCRVPGRSIGLNPQFCRGARRLIRGHRTREKYQLGREGKAAAFESCSTGRVARLEQTLRELHLTVIDACRDRLEEGSRDVFNGGTGTYCGGP